MRRPLTALAVASVAAGSLALAAPAASAAPAADAKPAAAPLAKGKTGKAKTHKRLDGACKKTNKTKHKLYHPARTTVVTGSVSLTCYGKTHHITQRVTLYRNGKKVDTAVDTGKQSVYVATSAKMWGTKCQSWKVVSLALAYNKAGNVVGADRNSYTTRKICP